MIARVVPVSSFATKHAFLLGCLDPLGTGSDTTTGDSMSDESNIVAATIKGNECVVQPMCFIPINVQISQLFRTCRIQSVGRIVDLDIAH